MRIFSVKEKFGYEVDYILKDEELFIQENGRSVCIGYNAFVSDASICYLDHFKRNQYVYLDDLIEWDDSENFVFYK